MIRSATEEYPAKFSVMEPIRIKEVEPNRRLEMIQEWSDIMKESSLWNISTAAGKILLGLVLTAMLGSISAVPAHSDDRRGFEKHDNGKSEQRGRGYDRGRHYNKHDRRYYRRDVYRERVYVAPPPVIYAPPEPLGISFFFPPIIFR